MNRNRMSDSWANLGFASPYGRSQYRHSPSDHGDTDNNSDEENDSNESNDDDKEQDDFDLNVQLAIIQSIDLNAKPKALTEREIWSFLVHEEPDIFKQRKRIVLERIDDKIQEYGGRTVHVDPDGNCLLNSFCFFLFDVVRRCDVQREREDVVDFMLEHRELFPTVPKLRAFARDREFLLGEHITAWHLLHRINVVLFKYHADRDGFSRQFWFKEKWNHRATVTIVHTDCGAGHYDYIADIHNTLRPERDYVHPPEGHKCTALKAFDDKYDYQAMIERHQKRELHEEEEEDENSEQTQDQITKQDSF